MFSIIHDFQAKIELLPSVTKSRLMIETAYNFYIPAEKKILAIRWMVSITDEDTLNACHVISVDITKKQLTIMLDDILSDLKKDINKIASNK